MNASDEATVWWGMSFILKIYCGILHPFEFNWYRWVSLFHRRNLLFCYYTFLLNTGISGKTSISSGKNYLKFFGTINKDNLHEYETPDLKLITPGGSKPQGGPKHLQFFQVLITEVWEDLEFFFGLKKEKECQQSCSFSAFLWLTNGPFSIYLFEENEWWKSSKRFTAQNSPKLLVSISRLVKLFHPWSEKYNFQYIRRVEVRRQRSWCWPQWSPNLIFEPRLRKKCTLYDEKVIYSKYILQIYWIL